ncbi:hypothetical protein B0T22DRAFT_483524 [Podospora appendiculata]|uniref:Ubiquitin-like domain-containing protein n=1 Tax=Podospora appendiculata TaxID=314037 RepID=A0AAE0X2U0_9PEZI|nr:hypothetical protein B0T22DRAFT_483524 [Podospora appendiculata]
MNQDAVTTTKSGSKTTALITVKTEDGASESIEVSSTDTVADFKAMIVKRLNIVDEAANSTNGQPQPQDGAGTLMNEPHTFSNHENECTAGAEQDNIAIMLVEANTNRPINASNTKNIARGG